MKVIDLFVKIANKDSDLPNKLLYKYKNKDFNQNYYLKWDEELEMYYTDNKEKIAIPSLIADNLWNLNDEIEIIEDKPKKIEKIKMNGNEFYSEYVDTWIEKSKYDAYCEYLSNKVNETIDKLNYLLKKSDKE